MSRINSDKARKLILAAPVDGIELAVLILEAYHGLKKPDGQSTHDCFYQLDKQDQEGSLRASKVALKYIAECVTSHASTVQ